MDFQFGRVMAASIPVRSDHNEKLCLVSCMQACTMMSCMQALLRTLLWPGRMCAAAQRMHVCASPSRALLCECLCAPSFFMAWEA